MPAPMVSDVLPDLIDEMAALLREAGADPLVDQLPNLRIESVCDCGDENCASFATASEVKAANHVELPATVGMLIRGREFCDIGRRYRTAHRCGRFANRPFGEGAESGGI